MNHIVGRRQFAAACKRMIPTLHKLPAIRDGQKLPNCIENWLRKRPDTSVSWQAPRFRSSRCDSLVDLCYFASF